MKINYEKKYIKNKLFGRRVTTDYQLNKWANKLFPITNTHYIAGVYWVFYDNYQEHVRFNKKINDA